MYTHLSRRTRAVTLLAGVFVVAAGGASASASEAPAYAQRAIGQAAPQLQSTATAPFALGPSTPAVAIPRLSAPGVAAPVQGPAHVDIAPAPAVSADLTTTKAFEGLSENGWEPSDDNATAGTKNVLQTVNEEFRVTKRGGALQYHNNFNNWFGVSGTLFDPVTTWDSFGKRFMFVVTSGSSLHLSVAQQESGVGNYCNYTFTTPSGYFADYEKLGVNSHGVYLTVNLYGSSDFTNELFFVNRAQLESCQTAGFTFWTGLRNNDGSVSFAIVPARADNGTTANEYLVNSYPGGACSMVVWKLSSGGSLSRTTIGTQCYSPPPAAAQAGSSGKIDTGDNRLYQAQFRSGQLLISTVGSHDWGNGQGQVGIVEWFEFNTPTVSLNSQGAFGTPGYSLFFPAVSRDSSNRKLFVYDSSSPSIHPSVWYISGNLSDSTVLRNGAARYGSSGTARWGDYQSAWTDPLNPSHIFISGQYAKAVNLWGTAVANVVSGG